MTRKTLSLAAVALLALAGAGAWYVTGQSSNAQTALPVIKASSETPQAPVNVEITEMTLGAADAPVKITEYASFTCPHCANFHDDQFIKLKAEYIDTGKVHFTYRDVYFDRIGLWASMLARCETPRFFGVSDLLYSKQGEWLNSQDPVVIADNLRKLGRVAGMADDKIDACMSDAATAQALVAWFETNRTADDISSTPTLIIDGEKHSNMSYAELKAMLDAKLGQ
jgi:protein-disulfide isomerase